MSRVSMRDIAKSAGCSVMSVSRALRNHPRVSPAMREQILAAAGKLGYIPDPALSALVAYRHFKADATTRETLGFLTSWESSNSWTRIHHYQSIFEGASRRAGELGYRLEHFWLREPGLRLRRAGDILYNRGIRGLIIAPLQVNIGHLRMDWTRFSAVTVGYSLAAPVLNYVATDYFSGILIAWRQLRLAGYRRIGLAIGRRHDTRSQHRWAAAFEMMQARLPLTRRVPVMIKPKELVKNSFDEWFAQERPDAVLSLGPGIPGWIREHGYRVPEDVAYVDLDPPSDGSGGNAGVCQNSLHQGAAATDLIHLDLQRFRSGIPQIRQGLLVEPIWEPGKTIRSPTGENVGKAPATAVSGSSCPDKPLRPMSSG